MEATLSQSCAQELMWLVKCVFGESLNYVTHLASQLTVESNSSEEQCGPAWSGWYCGEASCKSVTPKH